MLSVNKELAYPHKSIASLARPSEPVSMNDSTFRAIKAILEADQTVSDSQRAFLLNTCRNPERTEEHRRPDHQQVQRIQQSQQGLQRQRSRHSQQDQQEFKLLTIKEVAQILQVSERTIWNLTDSGELPRVRIGRSVRFRMEDVRQFCKLRLSPEE